MVSFEQALQIILTDVRKMDTERIDFRDALYRVLAEDIFADIDMPPFDKAAMDGYACRRIDLDMELEVIETIAAGQQAQQHIGTGQCTKIMTGAMVPAGADTVIMVEHTRETRPGHIRFTQQQSPANIAYKAEDVKTGDKVWENGMMILPQHIAVFASVGGTAPLVSKQPRVAVLSTGDELVEPQLYPPAGKIRNSNGSQLVAQIQAAHCIPNYMGIVPDSESATRMAIDKALSENDVVLLSGGVSMGDFDFVPAIMRELGVEIMFQKVAIKPGRPTVFGKKGKSYIFGLPGNPVSSFINFEVMVKPMLYRMMGMQHAAFELTAQLGFDFSRRKADRPEFIPVVMSGHGSVLPVAYHGSAHIHAMCQANALMFIPKDIFQIDKGANVLIRLLMH